MMDKEGAAMASNILDKLNKKREECDKLAGEVAALEFEILATKRSHNMILDYWRKRTDTIIDRESALAGANISLKLALWEVVEIVRKDRSEGGSIYNILGEMHKIEDTAIDAIEKHAKGGH